MVVCDGLKGLPDAIERGLAAGRRADLRRPPAAEHFRYAGRQHWDAIAKALKPVYTAPTEAAALERFAEFAEAWGRKYPAIVRLWENAWAEFVPFLAFDTEIRKVDLLHQRDRVGQRPDPPGGPGPRPLPQRAGRAQVRLPGGDEPRPDRHRPPPLDHPLESPLNAFEITFEGRLTPAND